MPHYGYVKVLKVMERSSRALFIPQGFEMCDETGEPDQSGEQVQADDAAAVAVGWKLITRRRE